MKHKKKTANSHSDLQETTNNSTGRSSGSSDNAGDDRNNTKIDIRDFLDDDDKSIKIVAESKVPPEEKKDKAEHKRLLQLSVAIFGMGVLAVLVFSSLGMIALGEPQLSRAGLDILKTTATCVVSLFAGASIGDFLDY
jgi:hypothetical protein